MLRLGTAGFAGSIGDSFFFLTTRSIRTNLRRPFSRSRVPKPVPPPLPTPTHVFHSLNAWIGGRNSTFPCCLTVELNICLKQQPTKNTKKIRRAVKRRDGKETSNGASERASERRRMGAAHCAAHAPVHFAPAREPAPLFC